MRSLFFWGLWLSLALTPSAQTLPDLGSLITEVLSRHPAVRKAEHEVAAAEAVRSGSRLQPNPTLTLSATAGEAAEDSNSLTQLLELSGQPRLRHQQAQAELDATEARLRSTRRSVAAQVCIDWLTLWETQHLAMLAELRWDLMQQLLRVTERRYEVGEIPHNEALRVELALAEAEAAKKRAEAEYFGAQRSLALLRDEAPVSQGMSLAALQPVPALEEAKLSVFQAPRLSPGQKPWSLEEVLLAAALHPDVEALRLERQAGLATAELVAKERAPQLGISLYRSRFFGTAYEQGAQLSLSWQLFDWGSVSARKKAQLFVAEARQAEAEAKALELRREVSELWSRWQAAIFVRDILAGQAQRYEELVRKARVGYDVGLLSLTDVLQTETAFREAGVELIKATAEVYRLELGLLENTNLAWPTDLLEEQ